MKRPIDHIVYCVSNLEAAIEQIAVKLGVKPVLGGRHLSQGTKNALVNIGNGCYLEILAVDEENQFHTGARWMGIDIIQEPKVTRWSLKTEQINVDADVLKNYSQDLGHVIRGRRETQAGSKLQWTMTLPLSEPEIELAPFFTDWSESASHPTDSLDELCSIDRIEFIHPHPASVRTLLEFYDSNIDLKKGEKCAIHPYIKSPKGVIKL